MEEGMEEGNAVMGRISSSGGSEVMVVQEVMARGSDNAEAREERGWCGRGQACCPEGREGRGREDSSRVPGVPPSR
jgi:hypothetical protein